MFIPEFDDNRFFIINTIQSRSPARVVKRSIVCFGGLLVVCCVADCLSLCFARLCLAQLMIQSTASSMLATTPALIKMEERKRSAQSVDELAPPSKRQAMNGSNKSSADDMPWKDDLEVRRYANAKPLARVSETSECRFCMILDTRFP